MTAASRAAKRGGSLAPALVVLIGTALAGCAGPPIPSPAAPSPSAPPPAASCPPGAVEGFVVPFAADADTDITVVDASGEFEPAFLAPFAEGGCTIKVSATIVGESFTGYYAFGPTPDVVALYGALLDDGFGQNGQELTLEEVEASADRLFFHLFKVDGEKDDPEQRLLQFMSGPTDDYATQVTGVSFEAFPDADHLLVFYSASTQARGGYPFD